MSLAFTGMIFHEVLEWSILLKCGWEQKFVIRGGHLQHALAKKVAPVQPFWWPDRAKRLPGGDRKTSCEMQQSQASSLATEKVERMPFWVKQHWVLKLTSIKFEYNTHIYCTWCDNFATLRHLGIWAWVCLEIRSIPRTPHSSKLLFLSLDLQTNPYDNIWSHWSHLEIDHWGWEPVRWPMVQGQEAWARYIH